ncbi:MAG: hypothetical protein AB1758_02270, partial [Candidatus Eremiobacterota bacterium]
MYLVRERVLTRVNADLEDRLWKHLCGLYTPLVTDVALGLRRALELNGKPVKHGGEMFLTPSGEILYYLVAADRRSLEVGSVSETDSSILLDFRHSIEEILGNGKKWTALPSVSERFTMIREDADPFRATPQDMEAAELLSRQGVRHLLGEVRENPGAQLSTLKGGRELEEDANQLDRMGLISRIFEVFCRDTGNKLLRTESYDALVEASNRGFKNFLSGRPILEERVEQLLSLTERGRRLSGANTWLALMVARVIQGCGIPERDILWLSEKDGRLLDLFVAYQGALFVFEVHERAVTPDQAFRFLTRSRYYRADAAFLVCPEQLGRDSSQVLNRSGAETLFVIEDLAELPARLAQVMARSSADNVQRLLARFQELTVLKVADLVGEHLLGPVPEEPEAEPGPESLEPEAVEEAL